MVATEKHPHPYAAVDITGLDTAFPELLALAKQSGLNRTNAVAREKRLFRFGLLAGQAEWELARRALEAMLAEKVLDGPQALRAAQETAIVRGLPACAALLPVLSAHGLSGPQSVHEALTAVRAYSLRQTPTRDACGHALTEREVFALGLGITWGARCYDT
jgi:hypothetical protein